MPNVVALTILGLAVAASPARAADPNPVNPPYVEEVYTTSAGGDGKGSEFMFWKDTFRGNEKDLVGLRAKNEEHEASGRYPITAFNTWLPGPIVDYLPGGAQYPSPGNSEYAQWVDTRRHLMSVNNEGSSPYAEVSSYITPMMPLDRADWPEGITDATFGDWMVHRMSGYFEETGTRGMFASDGWDSLWGFDFDYNPRVVDAFAKANNLTIPGTTVAEKASYIKSKHFKLWNDYRSGAFVKMYGGFAKAIWDSTGEPGLIAMQGTDNGISRSYGMDLRHLFSEVQANNGKFLKIVELQGDVMRELKTLGYGITASLTTASMVPDAWIGAQMTAPPALPVDYATQSGHDWSTATNLSGTWVNGAEREEFINKYLRAHWLTVGWGHIANKDGSVRRAMQAFHRMYHDSGKVPPEIENLLQNIRPVRPFGAAFYYSRSIADSFEQSGSEWAPAMSADGVAAQPVGYAVSDLALDGLASPANEDNKPTAFITSDLDRIPAEELRKLRSIAPVYDTKTAVRIPSPIGFSGDVNGYGFIDQNGRSIFLAFRNNSLKKQMHLAGNFPTEATMKFEGVKDGTYTLTDLFDSSKTYPVTISGGTGSVSFPMERWESRAFHSTIPSPNGNWTAPEDKDQIMLHWKLDESSGSNWAMDSSGAHRLGLLSNMDPAKVWQPGKHGNSLVFDDEKQVVSIEFAYPSTDFTQMLWFKTSTKPNSIYHVGSATTSVSDAMSLDDGGNIRIGPVISSGKNHADGNWHHVAVVREQGVGTRLYVNGVEVADTKESDAIAADNTSLKLGIVDWWGHYKGNLDDVRLYKRVLDASQIKVIFAAEPDKE